MVFTDKQENRTFILLANLKQVMFNHLYPDSFYKNDLSKVFAKNMLFHLIQVLVVGLGKIGIMLYLLLLPNMLQ